MWEALTSYSVNWREKMLRSSAMLIFCCELRTRSCWGAATSTPQMHTGSDASTTKSPCSRTACVRPQVVSSTSESSQCCKAEGRWQYPSKAQLFCSHVEQHQSSAWTTKSQCGIAYTI